MTRWLCGGRGPAGGRDEVDAVGTRVAGLSNPPCYREYGAVERRSRRRARYGIVEHARRAMAARDQLTREVVVEERPGAENQRAHRRAVVARRTSDIAAVQGCFVRVGFPTRNTARRPQLLEQNSRRRAPSGHFGPMLYSASLRTWPPYLMRSPPSTRGCWIRVGRFS